MDRLMLALLGTFPKMDTLLKMILRYPSVPDWLGKLLKRSTKSFMLQNVKQNFQSSLRSTKYFSNANNMFGTFFLCRFQLSPAWWTNICPWQFCENCFIFMIQGQNRLDKVDLGRVRLCLVRFCNYFGWKQCENFWYKNKYWQCNETLTLQGLQLRDTYLHHFLSV